MTLVEILEGYLRQGEKPWNYHERRLIEWALADLRENDRERRCVLEAEQALPGRGQVILETADGLRCVVKFDEPQYRHGHSIRRVIWPKPIPVDEMLLNQVAAEVQVKTRTYDFVGRWRADGREYSVYREVSP